MHHEKKKGETQMSQPIEVYILREQRTRPQPTSTERERLIEVLGLKRYQRYFGKMKCRNEPGPKRYRKLLGKHRAAEVEGMEAAGDQ